MSKLFLFNPEHDLCLADGRADYIPPASVVEFAQRVEWITRYMPVPASAGRVVSWGWNAVLKRRLKEQGWNGEELPSEDQLQFIRENSRREVAVEMLEHLWNIFGSDSLVTASYRTIALSMREIEAFLAQHNRIVLKAPLSGSGKGIRFITGELMETDRGWCRNILQRQGALIVEQRLHVVQEFAMLFECVPAGSNASAGKVEFRGYSLFYASNGAYKGNILASNEHIEKILTQYVPVELLHKVQEGIATHLQKKLSGRYQGFVGVDQFICRDTGNTEKCTLNPAVEINLRMTMGLVARNIYDKFKTELQLGNGTHCFEPEKGIFDSYSIRETLPLSTS